MFERKDFEKYEEAAERIMCALDECPVPISWHEMDRMKLQSIIEKELMVIDREEEHGCR